MPRVIWMLMLLRCLQRKGSSNCLGSSSHRAFFIVCAHWSVDLWFSLVRIMYGICDHVGVRRRTTTQSAFRYDSMNKSNMNYSTLCKLCSRLRVCIRPICHTRKHHRNISGSIQRSRANRLDELRLLSRSTNAKTERILLDDSSAGAGAGGGELCRFGFTTRTMIMPKTSRARRIIILRLVVRR